MSSYDQIDEGSAFGPAATPWTQAVPCPPSAGRPENSDRDGLSDVFERFVGTDAARVDTGIGDGLTDGYEASTGTDPLSTDTDRDRFTDELEIGQRGNPLTADGSGAVRAGPSRSGSQRRLAAMSARRHRHSRCARSQPGPTTQAPAPRRRT